VKARTSAVYSLFAVGAAALSAAVVTPSGPNQAPPEPVSPLVASQQACVSATPLSGPAQAIYRFVEELAVRYPKARESLIKDRQTLLTSYDIRSGHATHPRTSDPTESPFATVKARTKQTKGAGSRQAGLALALELAFAAQDRWRKVNAPHLVALTRSGFAFKDGKRPRAYLEAGELPMVVEDPLEVAA